MLGLVVWTALGAALVYAWIHNWPLHVPPEAGAGRRLLVSALYVVGLVVCVAGVVGSCTRIN